MESVKGRGQWILFGLVLVGLILYRTLFSAGGGGTSPEDLAAREVEINQLFERIPPYPGSQAPQKAKSLTPEAVIVEQVYPAQASYDQVKPFYVKEGPGIGWEPIGEQRNVPGFASPVQIFRSGEYHLLLTVSPTSIRLRMVWGPDLTAIVGQKILPD